jgi:hypothetical protein
MKPEPQFLRPRSVVVFDHTRRMLNATSLCVRKFAMRVAEEYVRLVAPADRQVPFRLGVSDVELLRAEKHNAQQLGRYMDGTLKALPADLEDAWVLALPEPYRSDCERELAKRRGRYAEKRMAEDSAGQAVGLGDLTREFGDLVQALAPALADGHLSEADLPHARQILNESDDLIAAVCAVRRQVTNLLPGQEGKAHA